MIFDTALPFRFCFALMLLGTTCSHGCLCCAPTWGTSLFSRRVITSRSFQRSPRRQASVSVTVTAISSVMRSRAMRSKLPNALAQTVHGFFGPYLREQRGLSRHTLLSYRDTLALLLRFIADTQDTDVASLDL